MSKHERIAPRRTAEQQAAWSAIAMNLEDCVNVAARTPGMVPALGEALCAALDTVCQGAPRYEPFADMRREARDWADMAPPLELEAYAIAALDRINRASFAERARKRLLWALWQSMTPQAQQSFLSRVDSKGASP